MCIPRRLIVIYTCIWYRCKVSGMEKELRTEITWECEKCLAALHILNCFEIYHSLEDYLYLYIIIKTSYTFFRGFLLLNTFLSFFNIFTYSNLFTYILWKWLRVSRFVLCAFIRPLIDDSQRKWLTDILFFLFLFLVIPPLNFWKYVVWERSR